MRRIVLLLSALLFLAGCANQGLSWQGQARTRPEVPAMDDQIAVPTPRKAAKIWVGPGSPSGYGGYYVVTIGLVERYDNWFLAYVMHDEKTGRWILIDEQKLALKYEDDKGRWVLLDSDYVTQQAITTVGLGRPRAVRDCDITESDEDGNLLMPSEQDVACMVGAGRVASISWRVTMLLKVDGIWWVVFGGYRDGWQLLERQLLNTIWGEPPEKPL